jgi:hypothetical protein
MSDVVSTIDDKWFGMDPPKPYVPPPPAALPAIPAVREPITPLPAPSRIEIERTGADRVAKQAKKRRGYRSTVRTQTSRLGQAMVNVPSLVSRLGE